MVQPKKLSAPTLPRIVLPRCSASCSSMSQEIDLEEKSGFYGETPCSSSRSSPDLVYDLHGQHDSDFPDSGLRAWLVVLGVRSL